MSNEQPKIITTPDTANLNASPSVPEKDDQVDMKKQGYDKDSDITSKLQQAQELVEEDKKVKADNQSEAESRLQALEAELKVARKEKEEQRNFILDKILLANIPRENFKKDDEFESEKTVVKNIINKYSMSYDDSEWFVKKAYPKIPQPEGKKGSNPLTAGQSTIFTPSSLTQSETVTEQPKKFCPSYPLDIEF